MDRWTSTQIQTQILKVPKQWIWGILGTEMKVTYSKRPLRRSTKGCDTKIKGKVIGDFSKGKRNFQQKETEALVLQK